MRKTALKGSSVNKIALFSFLKNNYPVSQFLSTSSPDETLCPKRKKVGFFFSWPYRRKIITGEWAGKICPIS
jgi:hypothetical protein